MHAAQVATWADFDDRLHALHGLKTVDVGGSPDCFFHCVLYWLERSSLLHLAPTVGLLRKTLRDEYILIGQPSTDELPAILSVVNAAQPLLYIKTWQQYLDALLGPLWGGDLEMRALLTWLRRRAVEVRVAIFTQDPKAPERIEPHWDGSKFDKHLLWQFAHFSDHYRVVLPDSLSGKADAASSHEIYPIIDALALPDMSKFDATLHVKYVGRQVDSPLLPNVITHSWQKYDAIFVAGVIPDDIERFLKPRRWTLIENFSLPSGKDEYSGGANSWRPVWHAFRDETERDQRGDPRKCLLLSVMPGLDTVKHYVLCLKLLLPAAKIHAYSFPLANEQLLSYTGFLKDLTRVCNGSLHDSIVVLGETEQICSSLSELSLSKLGSYSSAWYHCHAFANEKNVRIVLLGVRHPYWGDIAGRIATVLFQLGCRELIHCGNVGTLLSAENLRVRSFSGKLIALSVPNGRVRCYDYDAKQKRFVLDALDVCLDNSLTKHLAALTVPPKQHVVICNLSKHLSVPSPVIEDKDFIANATKSEVSMVDVEVFHLAKAAQESRAKLSCLHYVSDLISSSPSEGSSESPNPFLDRRATEHPDTLVARDAMVGYIVQYLHCYSHEGLPANSLRPPSLPLEHHSTPAKSQQPSQASLELRKESLTAALPCALDAPRAKRSEMPSRDPPGKVARTRHRNTAATSVHHTPRVDAWHSVVRVLERVLSAETKSRLVSNSEFGADFAARLEREGHIYGSDTAVATKRANKLRAAIGRRMPSPLGDSGEEFLQMYENWLTIVQPSIFASDYVIPQRTLGNFSGASVSPCGKHVYIWHPVELFSLHENKPQMVISGRISTASWSPDSSYLADAVSDSIRIRDVVRNSWHPKGKILTGNATAIAWNFDSSLLAVGFVDGSITVWDFRKGSMFSADIEPHPATVSCIAWSKSGSSIASGSWEGIIKIWHPEKRFRRSMTDHNKKITHLHFNSDGTLLASGSEDRTVRTWECESSRCLTVRHLREGRLVILNEVGGRLLSCDSAGNVLWGEWEGQKQETLTLHLRDLADAGVFTVSGQAVLYCSGRVLFFDLPISLKNGSMVSQNATEDYSYSSAKISIVGDPGVGKTALAYRLSAKEWRAPSGSTVGASLSHLVMSVEPTVGIEREAWLWDFAGQADQRLIHQIFLQNTSLILLVFDATKPESVTGLRQWRAALTTLPGVKQVLVASRVDATGLALCEDVAGFAKKFALDFIQTSALTGLGCKELHALLCRSIPWDRIPVCTSTRLFQEVKKVVLSLRNDPQALWTMSELQMLLNKRIPDVEFSDDILHTLVALLENCGALSVLLSCATPAVLLKPEWLAVYAQTVVRTIRAESSDLGRIPLEWITDGRLRFEMIDRSGGVISISRLRPHEERMVLREMQMLLEEHGICFRLQGSLVFPSLCALQPVTPKAAHAPGVVFSIKGRMEIIYSAVIVQLVDTIFRVKCLWQDAADFFFDNDHDEACLISVRMVSMEDDVGTLSVHYHARAQLSMLVLFLRYVKNFITRHGQLLLISRSFHCAECGTLKTTAGLLEKARDKREKAVVQCDLCDVRFSLFDELSAWLLSGETNSKQMQDFSLAKRQKGHIRLLSQLLRSRFEEHGYYCSAIVRDVHSNDYDMEIRTQTNLCIYVYLGVTSGDKANFDALTGLPPHTTLPAISVLGIFSQDELLMVRWRRIENARAAVSFGGELLDDASIESLKTLALPTTQSSLQS